MRPKRLAIISVCVFLCLTACTKNRSRSVALPPVPPAAPAAAPAAPAPGAPAPVAPAPVAVSASVLALERADSAFNAGNYDDACRGYETYLRETPPPGPRDHALFQLGLCYVFRSNPAPDWPRATATLKQLVEEHSGSPLKPAAALILSVRAELDKAALDAQQRDQRIRQLTSELDRLKKIDADRRKRP
jgi:hypothetical protein